MAAGQARRCSCKFAFAGGEGGGQGGDESWFGPRHCRGSRGQITRSCRAPAAAFLCAIATARGMCAMLAVLARALAALHLSCFVAQGGDAAAEGRTARDSRALRRDCSRVGSKPRRARGPYGTGCVMRRGDCAAGSMSTRLQCFDAEAQTTSAMQHSPGPAHSAVRQTTSQALRTRGTWAHPRKRWRTTEPISMPGCGRQHKQFSQRAQAPPW